MCVCECVTKPRHTHKHDPQHAAVKWNIKALVISLQTGKPVPIQKEAERGRKETHNEGVKEVKRGECDRSGKYTGATSLVALTRRPFHGNRAAGRLQDQRTDE